MAGIHTGVPSIMLNRGINGETSFQVVDRGQQYLLSDPWIRVCISLFGTNDSKPRYRTPIDAYLLQWDRLLRACYCTDTLLYALEIPAIDPVGQPEYDGQSLDHIQKLNDALRDWCAKNKVPFIDGLYKIFADDPSLLADGIHPTNLGNKLIAERIFEVLGKPLPYAE